MKTDLMQRQRFELKFRVNDSVAQAVRETVSRRLDPDPFGVDQPDGAYPIHSLYWDSPSLALYHSTVNGDRNRIKLRIRFYNDDPDGPVFLEAKRRVNECILKERTAIHRHRLDSLITSLWPTADDLLNDAPGQLETARSFCQRVDRLRARPVAQVAYRREAWFAPGRNSVRVTLDHQTICEPRDVCRISTQLDQPTAVFPSGQTILEIKFTERFPTWLSGLVQNLNLVRTSAAKYVDGLTQTGVQHRGPAHFAGF